MVVNHDVSTKFSSSLCVPQPPLEAPPRHPWRVARRKDIRRRPLNLRTQLPSQLLMQLLDAEICKEHNL